MDNGRLMLIVGIVFVVLTAFFCWCYAKKSEQVSKWGWRIIGLATAVFVVFSVWYHIPIPCKQTVQVYEETAPFTPVEVELDLVVHRSYLYGKWLTGSARTPTADYPRDYTHKDVNGVFTKWGERNLSLGVFRTDANGLRGSLRLALEFSRDWKTVVQMEMQDYPLTGGATFYVTEGSIFLDYWRSKSCNS